MDLRMSFTVHVSLAGTRTGFCSSGIPLEISFLHFFPIFLPICILPIWKPVINYSSQILLNKLILKKTVLDLNLRLLQKFPDFQKSEFMRLGFPIMEEPMK